MKIKWQIDQSDTLAIQTIVAEYKSSDFVIERLSQNVNGSLPVFSQSKIWHTQMMCLLTSQQSSGPNSQVSKLLNGEPFQLSLDRCKNSNNTKTFINGVLKAFGGIRFIDNIPNRAAENLDMLEAGGWNELQQWFEKLNLQRKQPPDSSHYKLERAAANYLKENYAGFGPKQSRNFWQELGLTRYEFVLDSRIIKWLKKIQFPVPLSSTALSDEEFYIFLSDILRELCEKSNVLPCLFDAAVFTSYDS